MARNRDRQLGVLEGCWNNLGVHSRTASPNLSPSRDVSLLKALTSVCLNAARWPAPHFQVTTQVAVRQKDREQNDAEFVETCT